MWVSRAGGFQSKRIHHQVSDLLIACSQSLAIETHPFLDLFCKLLVVVPLVLAELLLVCVVAVEVVLSLAFFCFHTFKYALGTRSILRIYRNVSDSEIKRVCACVAWSFGGLGPSGTRAKAGFTGSHPPSLPTLESNLQSHLRNHSLCKIVPNPLDRICDSKSNRRMSM